MRKSANPSGRGNRTLRAELAGVEVGEGLPVRVMAAINVSPESFYSASVARTRRALAARVRQAATEGADFIDLGAMSTAPYRRTWIAEEEERKRLVAAVQVASGESDLPVSVDTQRAAVAEAALAAGARIVNDVSGLAADPRMGEVVRQAEGVILMAHEEGPSHEPPLRLVRRLLRACLARARRAGIAAQRIVLDPGIGFFRQAIVPWYEFDVLVLAHLEQLRPLGHPLLVGASRKSFLGRLAGREDPEQRLPGSLAAATVAVLHGAHIVRAHDVGPTVDAVRVAEAIRAARRAR